MKNSKITPLLFVSILLFYFLGSCDRECEQDCEQGCEQGFTGEDCDAFDVKEIQFLLDNDYTIDGLLDAGIPVDSFYGIEHQGGLIFYLDQTSRLGFVAANNDFEDQFIWGSDTNTEAPNVSGLLSEGQDEFEEGARIGDGITNTESIILQENQATLGEVTAAEACVNLIEEGFLDWFLPSRGELKLMFTNLHENGLGDFDTDDDTYLYWTSTEQGKGAAWVLWATSQSNSYSDKAIIHTTRAARSFEF